MVAAEYIRIFFGNEILTCASPGRPLCPIHESVRRHAPTIWQNVIEIRLSCIDGRDGNMSNKIYVFFNGEISTFQDATHIYGIRFEKRSQKIVSIHKQCILQKILKFFSI